MAWVLGGGDSATFKRVYDKVKHLKNRTSYMDNWDAFAEILPPERHIIGKAHVIDTVHDNSNTRHHLAILHVAQKLFHRKGLWLI